MTFFGKKHRLAIYALCLIVVGAYLVAYFCVRRHRLSVEHVGSGMLFGSPEQAQQWAAEFHEEKTTAPLAYSDNAFLYVLFWPAIQTDSAISGRTIDSPFRLERYVVPKTNRKPQLPPGDRDHAPPQE